MITSHDLTTLFSSTRREAQSLLPQLVRRLIFASCSDSELLHFEMPGGDDVRLHGWDGRLTYSGSHPFIPTGHSVWEMGVSSSPETKANKDYAKRAQKPIGVTPTETTFVFVTPHVWADRKAWADANRAEGMWADVRVIDGSVLATWLERAPAVALWIADELGRSIHGLQTLDRFWGYAVANRYTPSITPDLIIGGRENTQEKLIEFLQSPSGAINLAGETAEVAAIFAAAVCKQYFTPEQQSRLLVLTDPDAAEHLATLSQDHIVLLTDPALYPVVRSDALNHLHFMIPEKRGARTNTTTEAIDLGTLRRNAVAASLQQMGTPKGAADHIATESKGSLHALLWMIARPEHGALDWANGRAATELSPLVLAGQWVANDHPDHEVIAKLTQRDYQEVKQTLIEWSGPGKPLGRRGAIWDWKAWRFAWTRLAPSLQREDIDRFLKITSEVLGTVDPALELPPEDRWLADIRGKVHRHSPALREGLAQSLVLLTMNGDLLPDTEGQAAVSRFVETLLQGPESAKRWISIASWLPDLAEAAPDAFIDSLERLTEDTVAIKELFTEGGMFGSSPHTHVLWALERLAWSPDHFGRVVLALGRLAQTDPGGKIMNRPSRSLRMILLPWHPATGASVADRISVLRLLFSHAEPIAWSCAASLLPKPHDMGEPFVRPKWRLWADNTNDRTTLQEYWSFQEQLVDLLLKHAGPHGDRWAVLLEAAPDLCEQHTELGSKVVDALRDLNPAELEREDAYALGDAARELVMRHENMHDADWAMKGVVLDRFKELSEHLKPITRRDQDRWLFTQWPEVLREYDLTMDEREERLRELRTEAISAVLEEEGWDALLVWAEEVKHTESLGMALAESKLTPEQEKRILSAGLDDVGTPNERTVLARLMYGYVFTKSRAEGDAWIEQAIAEISKDVDASAVSLLLQALPYGREVWTLVESQAAAVQAVYWSEIWLHVLSLEECEYVTPKLLAVNRPFKVIDMVSMLLHDKNKQYSDDQHDRIVTLVRIALGTQFDHLPSEEYGLAGTISYEIDELLDYLESRGLSRSDLAQWEWYWLPFISEGRRSLKALQSELSEDPELFVELLKSVYRPSTADNADPAEEEEPSVEERNRAHLAHRLLETWSRIPGLSGDAQHRNRNTIGEGLGPISPAWTGIIDEPALMAWIDRARDLASEADRVEICNIRIGRQLAYAPADGEGIWPCTEIRKVIELSRDEDLEQGMITGVINRRGVHSVGRDGAQELAMATQFREWCEHIRIEYPRTGAVLRRLAESYEYDAQREIERGRLEEFNG